LGRPESRVRSQASLKLAIDSLAFGGDGLARYPAPHPEAGKVVFVSGALPGERVEVRVKDRRRGYDRAEMVRVIDASNDRIRPVCPLFGRCGGCQLQHLAYPSQAVVKERWLAEMAGHIGLKTSRIQRIQASPGQYRYRFRARLAASEGGRIGFRSARSHRPVVLSQCPVMTKELEALVLGLGRLLKADSPGQRLEVEVGADKAGRSFALFTPQGEQPLRPATAKVLSGLADSLGAPVYIGRPRLPDLPAEAPQGSLVLPVAGLELHLFPGVFVQAQLPQNRALIRVVLDQVRPAPGQRVLELMAGMGNLSLPLAQAGARVKAVEINPLACANGRFNAARAGLEVDFQTNPAQAALRRAAEAGEVYDVVLLDPPRTGIKDLIESLGRLAPARVVYVSCHPASLVRDLKNLKSQGYEVKRIIPLDLLPQTYHLESVTLLER